jgi:hypothetical protein
VNASLLSAGGITGTVTAAEDGSPLEGVQVIARDSNSNQSYAGTDIDGAYDIGGLTPGTYSVCFDALNTLGGLSSTGYLDQCFDNVAWDGQSDPTGVTFTVAAGTAVAGKNAALDVGGAISGTVTASVGSDPVPGVSVEVWSATGDGIVGRAQTGDDGTYQVLGLPSSATGYAVCFRTDQLQSPPTGYVGECYDNAAWDQDSSAPNTSTLVPVTAGAETSSIDADLAAGAGIGGTVTAAADGAPLTDVGVTIFDGTGTQIAFRFTDADGAYLVSGLPASGSGYSVCFDPSSGLAGYSAECYDNVPWDGAGLPGGVTAVAATAGVISSADATLSSS